MRLCAKLGRLTNVTRRYNKVAIKFRYIEFKGGVRVEMLYNFWMTGQACRAPIDAYSMYGETREWTGVAKGHVEAVDAN